MARRRKKILKHDQMCPVVVGEGNMRDTYASLLSIKLRVFKWCLGYWCRACHLKPDVAVSFQITSVWFCLHNWHINWSQPEKEKNSLWCSYKGRIIVVFQKVTPATFFYFFYFITIIICPEYLPPPKGAHMTRLIAFTQSSISLWELAMSKKVSWLTGVLSFSPVAPKRQINTQYFWKRKKSCTIIIFDFNLHWFEVFKVLIKFSLMYNQ